MARVLIIDDNEDLRELVQVILVGAGYDVELAEDGQSGVAAQRVKPADLIVTDIFMPVQDGIETIAQVRREFPNVKILAVSGGGKTTHSRGYLTTASQIGADDTLAKPFEHDQLLRAVADLLATTEPST